METTTKASVQISFELPFPDATDHDKSTEIGAGIEAWIRDRNPNSDLTERLVRETLQLRYIVTGLTSRKKEAREEAKKAVRNLAKLGSQSAFINHHQRG